MGHGQAVHRNNTDHTTRNTTFGTPQRSSARHVAVPQHTTQNMNFGLSIVATFTLHRGCCDPVFFPPIL